MMHPTSTDPEKSGNLVFHLAELRKRLIIIIVVNLLVAMVCYNFMPELIQFFLALNPGMELIYISPEELFMVYVKLALIVAIVLCFPITAYEIWAFIRSGLFTKERLYVLLSFFLGLFFFLIGVMFSYIVVLPIILGFFIRITIQSVSPMISINSYISFCLTMLLSFGITFELPVVVFLLSELEILKPEFLKRVHGAAIILIFIIAAIITPPDVASQVLLAVPMTILLELSMVICQLVARQKKMSHALNR